MSVICDMYLETSIMVICMQLSSYTVKLDMYVGMTYICAFYSIYIDLLSIIQLFECQCMNLTISYQLNINSKIFHIHASECIKNSY